MVAIVAVDGTAFGVAGDTVVNGKSLVGESTAVA